MAMEQEQREAMGQRIKELREARRLRQQAMADAVGVSLRAYQAWEAGDTGIKWENAEALAVALETSASHILHGDLREKVDGTPDPFAAGDLDTRLANIEQALANRIDHDRKIDAMLERQTAILKRIETLVLALPTDEETEELLRAARGEDQPDQQDKRAPAKDERDTGARRRAEG